MVKLSDSLLRQIKENKKLLSKRDRLFLEELKEGKTYEELVNFLHSFLETLKHSYKINPSYLLLENENHEFSYGRVKKGYHEVPKIKKSLNISKRGYITLGILGILLIIFLISVYAFTTSKHSSISDRIEHKISKKVSKSSSSSSKSQEQVEQSSSSTEQKDEVVEQSSSSTEVSEPIQEPVSQAQSVVSEDLNIQQYPTQTDIYTDYTQTLPNTIQ